MEVRLIDYAELSPVDYVIVEFVAGEHNVPAAMTRSLLDLVDRGVIRVLDLLIVTKSALGDISVTEVEDLGEASELGSLTGTLAEILAADDIDNLARAIRSGATAAVIVWENIGVASISASARQVSAQIVAQGRIPSRAIVATLEADHSEAD
ncbi:DUF6325 family protein [Williamsia soli]|uniref:DUF6325 family protein n=1 Tax=Williamsia soli TaxID=364929 RepID=UPI001A9E0CDC|nr:DUF6325 family protein [Williamsia soli]